MRSQAAFLIVVIGSLVGMVTALSVKSETQIKGQCFLDEIEFLKPFNCTGLHGGGDLIAHGGLCSTRVLIHNTSQVESIKCDHGHWVGTRFSVGDVKHPKKRFLFLIPFLILCILHCRSSPPPPPPKYPPEFPNPCTPEEIKSNYEVTTGNSVQVSWTNPVASDKNGGKPIVEQVSGGANGGHFQGTIGGLIHSITYMAKDSDGLKGYCQFSFTVTVLTCAVPLWPTNGLRKCDDFHVGSQCQYECHTGYRLSGNSIITCENAQTPTWAAIPTCEKVTCEPPTPPTNGRVDCADRTYPYLSVCTIKCNESYSLQGPLYTHCLEDGTWDNVGTTTCIDDSPPSIVCKTPQIFYADRGSSSTSVTWEMPTVTDRIDPAPELNKTSGPSMDDVISVGSEYVTYLAIDSDRNKSPECTIELRVLEISCGHPLDTLHGDFLAFNCSGARYTYGVECRLSCLAHLPLNGTDLITCEDNGEAVGEWDWGNGTEPFCNDISCPELDPPINGALIYDTFQGRPAYTMMCNGNHDIPAMGGNFNGLFFCFDTTGWKPISIVPDCILDITPRFLRLPGEMFYYGGDCGTNETMAEIEQNFNDIRESGINPLLGGICPPSETCTAGKIVIRCGPIEITRKRRATRVLDNPIMDKFRTPINSVVEYPHTIQKRQAEIHVLVVEFDIVLTMTLPEGASLVSNIPYYDAIMASLSSATRDFLINGSHIQNFTTKSYSWQTPSHALVDCDTGYILVGEVCQPCPLGHYLNETTHKCDQCPIGQYADGEGRIDCILCPAGYSTKQIGSKFLDNCTELCGTGTTSPDGMQPCSSCLYGEYQDGVGQTTCKQCSSGTTTQNTKSTSSQDCQSYDILLQDMRGPVSLANIPSTMYDMTLMFWTKRDVDQTQDTTIQLKSDGNDRCLLYLTENVRLQIPNNIDETVEELGIGIWKHVAVIWNTAVNMLKVYINGDVKFSSTVSSSSPLITNGEVILTVTGYSGIHLTGLHLKHTALNMTEIVDHATSCHVTDDDDVINMDVFRDIYVEGLYLLSPSKCDAIDNCEPDPCNGHQCTDGQDTFVCHCNSGWSGETCSVPPDYCINNECTNGSTCQNGLSNYTCDCLPRYSGYWCEIPPVDGGWSEWDLWSACTQRCNSGNQTRNRTCDSPVPDLYGADCEGPVEETVPCNTDACQVCVDMDRKNDTLLECSTDATTGSRICNLYCEKNKLLPPGLRDFQEYNCGPDTNYEWQPMDKMPSCVGPVAPRRVAFSSSVEYNNEISELNSDNLTDSLLNNVMLTPCSVHCQTEIQRSSTDNVLTISFSLNLTHESNLELDTYTENGTVSDSLQELLDAVNYLELTAQYLQNNTEDIFNAVINGITYTIDTSTLTFEPEIACAETQFERDGVCIECPAGTYSDGVFCHFCDRGTYQPLSGQASCIQCPSGVTTATLGSSTYSQCSEYFIITTPVPASKPSGIQVGEIVGIVVSVIIIVHIVIIILIVVFKCPKKFRLSSKPNTVSDSDFGNIQERPNMARFKYEREVSKVSLGDLSLDVSNPVYDSSPLPYTTK